MVWQHWRSNVPEEELIEIELENDELKIDGNLAVCWSSNLDFTVERTTKTLVGSAVSGEGLVNVYRGTGKSPDVSGCTDRFRSLHQQYNGSQSSCKEQ